MTVYEGSGTILGFSLSAGHIDVRQGELTALGLKPGTSDTFSVMQRMHCFIVESVLHVTFCQSRACSLELSCKRFAGMSAHLF